MLSKSSGTTPKMDSYSNQSTVYQEGIIWRVNLGKKEGALFSLTLSLQSTRSLV